MSKCVICIRLHLTIKASAQVDVDEPKWEIWIKWNKSLKKKTEREKHRSPQRKGQEPISLKEEKKLEEADGFREDGKKY